MEDFLRFLKARLDEIKPKLDELEKLIKVGIEMGQDVSKYRIELQKLKATYEKYKSVYEKYSKK